MSEKNPVLYIHQGVKVRKLNRVELLLPEHVFRKIIDACEQSGMSIHKVLYYSGRPCERCDPEITVYGNDGIGRKIKKGLLNLPESNGVNIIQKAKNIKK
jgi:hypothetical protein